jgi:hypothetical protein
MAGDALREAAPAAPSPRITEIFVKDAEMPEAPFGRRLW